MAKFLAEKHFNSLRAVDEVGSDILRRIPMGRTVSIEVRLPRNERFHRLYWALVSLVWDNVDHDRYPTAEDLHAALKIAAGLRTQIVLPDGTVGFIAGSTAFHKMDQTEFSAFFDRVCDLVAKHFLPGVSNADLKAEVEQMIGAMPEMPVPETTKTQGRLDDLGSVQDGRKMSTDGQAVERRIREGSSSGEAEDAGVTAGETATSSNLSKPVEGDDGRAEKETAAPRISFSADDRAFLGRFAAALRPGTDSKELFDLRQKFGKAAGMWPSPGTDLRKGIEKIYAIETSRAVGEFGPEDADARIEDLLS